MLRQHALQAAKDAELDPGTACYHARQGAKLLRVLAELRLPGVLHFPGRVACRTAARILDSFVAVLCPAETPDG